MSLAELLNEVQTHGGSVDVSGRELALDAPENFPDDLIEQLRQRKSELLYYVRLLREFDWPWPLGYGGLPKEQIVLAEIKNDRERITDPIERRLNLLFWMWTYFRDQEQQDMAKEMREEYHLLRHEDKRFDGLCGLCT